MIMIDCVTALYQGMLRGPQSTLFGGLLFGPPPASKVAESPSKHIIDIFLKFGLVLRLVLWRINMFPLGNLYHIINTKQA